VQGIPRRPPRTCRELGESPGDVGSFEVSFPSLCDRVSGFAAEADNDLPVTEFERLEPDRDALVLEHVLGHGDDAGRGSHTDRVHVLQTGEAHGRALSNVTRMGLLAVATVASMTDDSAVRLIPLPEPRQLTLHEQGLLDFLLSGPVDSPALRAQAATAVVDGTCNCGCPSLQLAVDDSAPSARLSGPEVLPSGGAEIRAVGFTEEGLQTLVTLHIVGDVQQGEGVMCELECWPFPSHEGYWPADHPSALPAITTLRFA
jgi:hypothetical protein